MASGTAAAIAQAIVGKKSHALEKFAEAVRPKIHSPGAPAKRGPKTVADYRAGVRDLMLEQVPG